ncbi:uncharacterized protein LOC129600424 [Paramacrobiotus metropolitanus]|uniref:uncharacterized protein LOC129600424 n=1 Tax=Paramacrobiotus metropolitanus TaxID=2943436 RepID=UPI002445C997|nr:uncharacterized protein LOC129600424 [Paramacrobiotus metropolitanus]
MEGKWLTVLEISKLLCIFIVEILLGCYLIGFTVWKLTLGYGSQPDLRFVMSRALELIAAIILLCSGILRHFGIRRFLFGPSQPAMFLWVLLLNVVLLALARMEALWIVAGLGWMTLSQEKLVPAEILRAYGLIPLAADFLIIRISYDVILALVRFYTTIEMENALERAAEPQQTVAERKKRKRKRPQKIAFH